MRILIVDDNTTYAIQLKKFLLTKNFIVDTAETIKSAINTLKTNTYDVILLDLIIGSASGIELLKWANKNNNKSRIIVVTGYPCIDTAVESMKLGAVDYIQKPFDTNTLLSILENINSALYRKKRVNDSIDINNKIRQLITKNKSVIIIDTKPEKIEKKLNIKADQKIRLNLDNNALNYEKFITPVNQGNNIIVFHGGFRELFLTKPFHSVVDYFQKLMDITEKNPIILLYNSQIEKTIIHFLFNNSKKSISLYIQLLGSEIRQMILQLLLIHGKLRYSYFLKYLKIGHSSKIAFHLRKLHSTGLIEKNDTLYFLSPLGYDFVHLFNEMSMLMCEKSDDIMLYDATIL